MNEYTWKLKSSIESVYFVLSKVHYAVFTNFMKVI
jgi:hypothetical protein